MCKKTIALAIIVIFCIGAVNATTLTVKGFEKAHIGNAGLLDVKEAGYIGICADYSKKRSDPNTYKITSTKNIKNSNQVKQLIVKYYYAGMGKKAAYNLQYAVWYFTNGIKPKNPTVKKMIHSVKSGVHIHDTYLKLISSKVTTKSSTNTTIKLIDSQVKVDNQTCLIGNTTKTNTFWKCNCKYINTTTTTNYRSQIITTYLDTYQKNTTTKTTTILTNKYLKYSFYAWKGSNTPGKKQKLIFWKTTPITKVNQKVKTTPETTTYNTTSQDCKNQYWNTTKTTTKKVCCQKPCKPCKPVKKVCHKKC